MQDDADEEKPAKREKAVRKKSVYQDPKAKAKSDKKKSSSKSKATGTPPQADPRVQPFFDLREGKLSKRRAAVRADRRVKVCSQRSAKRSQCEHLAGGRQRRAG